MRNRFNPLSQCCTFLSIFGLAGLMGCGAADTPAEFQAGTTSNLDGAVITNDGNTMTIALTDDGSAIESVVIETSEGTETVGFSADRPEGSTAAIPSDISTARGNEFAFDSSTGTARITTTLPFSSTPTTFDVDLGDNPFGSLSARAANQDAGTDSCAAVRDSIDEFCEFFLANAEAEKEELIRVATEIALGQVDESLASLVPGFVSEVINDFFDTLQVLCDAWTEMRTGTAETDPVDPCNL